MLYIFYYYHLQSNISLILGEKLTEKFYHRKSELIIGLCDYYKCTIIIDFKMFQVTDIEFAQIETKVIQGLKDGNDALTAMNKVKYKNKHQCIMVIFNDKFQFVMINHNIYLRLLLLCSSPCGIKHLIQNSLN